MCSAAKSVAKSIIGVVKSSWNFIRKHLAIVLFVAVLFFPYLAPFMQAYLSPALYTFLTTGAVGKVMMSSSLSMLAARGLIGLGIAYILSSEAAEELVDKVAGAAGFLVGAAGAVLGGALSGIPAWVWLAGAGVAFFLLVLRNKKGEHTTTYIEANESTLERESDDYDTYDAAFY